VATKRLFWAVNAQKMHKIDPTKINSWLRLCSQEGMSGQRDKYRHQRWCNGRRPEVITTDAAARLMTSQPGSRRRRRREPEVFRITSVNTVHVHDQDSIQIQLTQINLLDT